MHSDELDVNSIISREEDALSEAAKVRHQFQGTRRFPLRLTLLVVEFVCYGTQQFGPVPLTLPISHIRYSPDWRF